MANLSALKAGGVPSTFCGYTVLSAADGDIAVTGIGFKPRWIMVTGLQNNSGSTENIIIQTGFKNSGGRTGSQNIKHDGNGVINSAINSVSSGLYNAYINGSTNAYGILKSFDADGFTIDKQGYGFSFEIYWIVGR